jgi:hypothetical protein
VGKRQSAAHHESVARLDSNLRCIEAVAHGPQGLENTGIPLDHQDAERPARSRLKSKDAGPGEELENAPALEILSEPVE